MEEVGEDGGKVGWVHVERVGVRTTGVYGSWAASEKVQRGRVGGVKTTRIVYTWLRPDGGPASPGRRRWAG